MRSNLYGFNDASRPSRPYSYSSLAQVGSNECRPRPLRWIVAYAAGGGTDALARVVAERLQPELKQTIIVDDVNADPRFRPVMANNAALGIRGVPGGALASGNSVEVQFSNVPFDGGAPATIAAVQREVDIAGSGLHLDGDGRLEVVFGDKGTALEYLENTIAHLDQLGIAEGPLHRILALARRKAAGATS